MAKLKKDKDKGNKDVEERLNEKEVNSEEEKRTQMKQLKRI